MRENMSIPSQHEIENRLKQFVLRKEQEVLSCHRSYEVSTCWTQPFPALDALVGHIGDLFMSPAH